MSGIMTGCHVGVYLINPFTLEGSRRPRHPGGLSFRTFSLAAQRKDTLHLEKPTLSTYLDSRLRGNDE